jgi:4-hydroxyphenylpyruvate dioxygenase-like putative hemolysin
MTRLDHIAYRVNDRHKTAAWLQKRLGLQVQTEFEITHKDGSTTKCLALEPKDKIKEAPWKVLSPHLFGHVLDLRDAVHIEYHMPPEIFVSSSDDINSMVNQWVHMRGGVGGIHHLALQVDDVRKTMEEWKEDGVTFTTPEPLTCPGLTQIFTEPHPLCGHIFELIEREDQGFCAENVGDLMESTRHLSKVKVDHGAVEQLKDAEMG